MSIFTTSLTTVFLLIIVGCSNEAADNKDKMKEPLALGSEITLEGQLPTSLTKGMSPEEKSKLTEEILPNASPDDPAPEEKFQKLREDAKAGNAKAQTTLGVMYFTGEAISKDASGKILNTDAAKAAAWFHRAALQGNADAQFNLGLMYATGQGGLTQDSVKAVDFFRKSALQGNADAQNNLGAMYHIGEGIKQDNAEAKKWYAKSAAQGNADAQANLSTVK
jgi:TPR repeat protein